MQYIVCIVIAALAGWTISEDIRTGKTYTGRRRNLSAPRRMLKRAEYPLIFWTLLLLKVLAAALLILIISGSFMRLIQWSI